MKRGLTPKGLGAVGSIEAYIDLAARYGFEAIDVRGTELVRWTRVQGIEAARSLLQAQGVRLGAIGMAAEWRNQEAAFRESLGSFALEVSAAAELHARVCYTHLPPSVDEPPARFALAAVRRLRLCADVLADAGMRLALEYVGPHHLRSRFGHPFLWDLESALELIDAIDRKNVGLLIDSYHWHTTGGTAEDILKLDAGHVLHVHLNDAPYVPVPEARDDERLYPGEGTIDLPAFLGALSRIGYTGIIAQEVFTAAPPSGTAEQLAARSKAAYDRVYARAGLL